MIKRIAFVGVGNAHGFVVLEIGKWTGGDFEKIDQTWGATTTPLLSAECQIEILQGLIPTLSRGLPLRLLSDILATFLATSIYKVYFFKKKVAFL
jgi:hypothetical protein